MPLNQEELKKQVCFDEIFQVLLIKLKLFF